MDNTLIPAIREKLNRWYTARRRDLPWRKTRDPYRIWLSEAMLQQTQVNTVIPYYHRFTERFPDVHALAGADMQEVLKMWEGLGYYARARNLHKAARTAVERYGGEIPPEWSDICALPGVGDYIASAVLSIAFDRPFAVVDGNVKRVLARLFCIESPVNDTTSYKHFRETAQALLDVGAPGLHNQAVMELGALVCKPKKPLCGECPVSLECRAFQSGRVGTFPVRKARPAIPMRHFAAGLVFRDGRLLIVRRPTDGMLGGLWEFPGGFVEKSEPPEKVCVAEIAKRTGIAVEVVGHLGTVRHAYTHFKLELDAYRCRFVGGKNKPSGPADARWIDPSEFGDFPFHKAAHKVMARLLKAAAK